MGHLTGKIFNCLGNMISSKSQALSMLLHKLQLIHNIKCRSTGAFSNRWKLSSSWWLNGCLSPQGCQLLQFPVAEKAEISLLKTAYSNLFSFQKQPCPMQLGSLCNVFSSDMPQKMLISSAVFRGFYSQFADNKKYFNSGNFIRVNIQDQREKHSCFK